MAQRRLPRVEEVARLALGAVAEGVALARLALGCIGAPGTGRCGMGGRGGGMVANRTRLDRTRA